MDLGSSSTGPVVIGRTPSLKKRNRSSFATEKAPATGAVDRDTEVVAEAAAETVLTPAVVTDHRLHVSSLVESAVRV